MYELDNVASVERGYVLNNLYENIEFQNMMLFSSFTEYREMERDIW